MFGVLCKEASPLYEVARRASDVATAEHYKAHRAHSTPPTHSSHSPPNTNAAARLNAEALRH